MNKMMKKSILMILIATMLIAPSMSLTQVHAQGETLPPQPTGPIYFYPSIDNVAYYYPSSYPPSLGGEGDYSLGTQLLSPDRSTGYQIYPLPDIKTQYFYVFYTYPVSVISGQVEVFVQYDPTVLSLDQQKHLRLCIYDPVDFNLDGTVNGQDIALMQQAIKSGTNPYGFDINHDGLVNNADLIIVKQFASHGLIVNPGHDGTPQRRLPWLDITAGVDTTLHYVYGFTDHFSVFGVR